MKVKSKEYYLKSALEFKLDIHVKDLRVLGVFKWKHLTDKIWTNLISGRVIAPLMIQCCEP